MIVDARAIAIKVCGMIVGARAIMIEVCGMIVGVRTTMIGECRARAAVISKIAEIRVLV